MIEVFVPCKDFEESLRFYEFIGFNLSNVVSGDTKTCNATYPNQGSIILQDFYVKDWAENTMMTLNIEDLDAFINTVKSYQSDHASSGVRFNGPSDFGWGTQIHLIDPSGVLWHVFQKQKTQP